MNIGICEWNIPVQGFEGRFQWAAEAGLRAIELDLEHAEGNETLINDLSNHWNIEVPTLGINFCCGHSMCDPAEAEPIHAVFEKAIEVALKIGAAKLQVPSFGKSFIETDAGFESTVERYRFLCSLAEGTGLLIGTENALSAEQQLELLDRVGSEQLRIYFDTRNAFSMQGYDSAAILEKLYPHICEVHLKDGIDNGPSCALGAGNSGFFQCLEILQEKTFDGWMLLENDYKTIDACKADIEMVARKTEN